MFDFLKRKSYDIEDVNGMKKLVIAKNVNNDLKNLKENFEKFLDILKDVSKSDKLKTDQISKTIDDLENSKKEISDFLEAYEKVENLKDLSNYKNLFKTTLKEIKTIEKVFGIDLLGKNKPDTGETSTEEEVNIEKINDGDTNKEEVVNEIKETNQEENTDVSTESNSENKNTDIIQKDSLDSKDIKLTADKAPGSYKYRAEGIKERLLEINKEVVNVKTPGVTYVGGVDKSVITPGPKSTQVKVKEEVVKPNKVIEQVKIKIMRDEGEKGKLLPNKNIKMPKGDVVVKKAATDNQKVKQLSEDQQAQYYAEKEKAKLENKSAEELDNIDKKFNVQQSLYDEVMFKVFAENNTEVNKESSDIDEVENIDPYVKTLLKDIQENI